MDLEDLVRALRAADSPHVEVIDALIHRGPGAPEVHVWTVGHPSSLLPTYRIRGENLKKYSSAHALELRRDIQAMVAAIEMEMGDTCQWVSLKTTRAGESYLVLWQPQSRRALGCLHMFSQIELTDEEWRELWGE
jgi:hypothetical protein